MGKIMYNGKDYEIFPYENVKKYQDEIANGKNAITNALTEKGAEVPVDATFLDMADIISKMSTDVKHKIRLRFFTGRVWNTQGAVKDGVGICQLYIDGTRVKEYSAFGNSSGIESGSWSETNWEI